MKKLNRKLCDTILLLSDENPEFKKYVNTTAGVGMTSMSDILLSEILVDFRKFFNSNIDFGDYFDDAIIVHDRMLENKRDITAIKASDFNVNDVCFNDVAFERTFVVFADNDDVDDVVNELKQTDRILDD